MKREKYFHCANGMCAKALDCYRFTKPRKETDPVRFYLPNAKEGCQHFDSNQLKLEEPAPRK